MKSPGKHLPARSVASYSLSLSLLVRFHCLTDMAHLLTHSLIQTFALLLVRVEMQGTWKLNDITVYRVPTDVLLLNGGGWVEVDDVDNLGVTVLSGVPSGTHMLAYMGEEKNMYTLYKLY